jgi:hypothetical protein
LTAGSAVRLACFVGWLALWRARVAQWAWAWGCLRA